MKLGSELLGNQGKKGNILDYIIFTTEEKKKCYFFSRETNRSLVLHSNRQSSPEVLLRDSGSVRTKGFYCRFIACAALTFMWLFLVSALNKS